MKYQSFRKFILLNFCLLTFNFLLQAQPPLRFSYQSIIRNPAGQALQNQAVGMRLSILQSSETGTAVYVETHTATTNTSGLVSLQVGGGTVLSGSMAAINWAAGPYFIKTETAPGGGSNYSITGTSQLLSVPFAQYAEKAANGLPAGSNPNQLMYWNGTAWTQLNPGNNGQTLTICNGILTWTTGGVCPANLPTLNTTAASAITTTTASSGGNITSDGGGSITARGVCWSTSQNPTIALSTKTSDGTGTGSFASSLTGLSPNTLYYARAYATNAAGTAYGNQISFTTASSTNPVDADGNTYTTVTIGSQVWMKENLKTSKYRNGDAIPTNLSDAAWSGTTTGAYSIYNNDAANNSTYGKLYNWYAVADPRGLCPAGWHVPTDHDWNLLTKYLDPAADTSCIGCGNTAGGTMKSTGTIEAGTGLWLSPNTDANNSSGFTGLPGGGRNLNGTYLYFGYFGIWWSSTELPSPVAWYRYLGYNLGYSLRYDNAKTYGFSVRCLRD